jgi:hypothetical protein
MTSPPLPDRARRSPDVASRLASGALAVVAGLMMLAAAAGSAAAESGASPTATADTTIEEEPINPFVGRDFLLFGDEIDVALQDNDIESLESRGSVYLETDGLEVTGGRLQYIASTGDLNVWQSPDVLVRVVREGVTSHCHQFIYNTESGEVTYVGRSTSVIDRDGQKTYLEGDDVTITQREGGEGAPARTIIQFHGGASISSRERAAPAPAPTPTPEPTPRPTPALP